MSNSTKILYEHLKDYPTSTEGFNEISAPALAAALYCEHLPAPSDEYSTGRGRESLRADRHVESERRAG